ncbi:DUF4105 domain-containing protein [bacterium]|nr:DUF4105 domain-containing protein [bacterium]
MALAFFALFPREADASTGEYAESLAERAVSTGLHERREWHVLLHYRPALLGRFTSLVDDPAFFNSPSGKDDPGEELRETVKAFFRDDLEGDAHPQCRFIARYRWLSKELSIDRSKLPAPECKGYDELILNMNPRSAVLVFPVSHINSPASMFGHTLLRIDSDRESTMFSFAVNYSAVTPETSGILFAVKGLTGAYKGYFGVLPYYEKIKEYSFLENRDMWEYSLDFTPEEVERMLLHLWELKDIYSDYYFFDENCSYNLLLALEAARPETDLLGLLPPWVIPMDTVRAVKKTGMSFGEARYRPSKASRIRHIEGLLDKGLRAAALDLASGALDPDELVRDEAVPRDKRAMVLDLASEYVQYRYAKRKLPKEEYTARYIGVLGARSTLGLIPPYDISAPAPPDDGHGPARLSIGVGFRDKSEFASIKLRPANHALMDPQEGYLPGAAITFLEGEARYDFDGRGLQAERLTLLEIISISPRDRFFKPISWRVTANALQKEYSGEEPRTVAGISADVGLSYGQWPGALVYAFAGPEAKAGRKLDKGYALGAGVKAGVIGKITERWKAQLEFIALAFGPGDSHDILAAELNQTFTTGKESAVMLNLKREDFDGFYSTEAAISLNLYY